MAGEDGNKEKEKDGKKEKEKEKEKEKVEEGIITAVYKVNLHCQQCARDIKKPLLTRTQGVHSVDADFDKSELKVKGVIDPIKIQKQIEKLSKKKVELISPKPKIKEIAAVEKKVVKEIKQPILRTISAKVNMHCGKCEQDLKKRLLKHRGIHSVKTDMKAQTLTVDGTIENDKLLSYLKKKVHKNAEIITSKPEKKEEKAEKEKGEGKSTEKPAGKGEGKSTEKSTDKGEGKSTEKPTNKGEGKSTEKPPDKGEGKSTEKLSDKGEGKSTEKPPNKGEGKSTEKPEEGKTIEKTIESTKIIEATEDIKIVEVKTKENAPYFIHYVYAPQMFSDENPNACSVM